LKFDDARRRRDLTAIRVIPREGVEMLAGLRDPLGVLDQLVIPREGVEISLDGRALDVSEDREVIPREGVEISDPHCKLETGEAK